jgi:glutathione peroxidase
LSFYDFSVTTLAGTDLALSTLRGRVVLVVNTASACGFTPQLAGLEALWLARRDQGLVVLGFPCNQFGAQEPGSAPEIQNFCTSRYGVSFPLMAKVDVNGLRAEPLFVWLKAQAPGWLGTQAIKWNFTKFLIGRDGQVLERYAPSTRPEQLQRAMDRALL